MNTPKHLQLIEAFGGKAPQYAHIPLILNGDGSKMSKRDAGAAVGDYPRQGFLSAAVVNFLALLGWNPKTDEEIFTPADLIERFTLENVNRAPGRFDLEKCRWMNQQHIARMSAVEFSDAAKPFVVAAGLPVDGDFPSAAAAVKEKVRLLGEVPQAVDFLLGDEFPHDGEAVGKVLANPAALPVLFAFVRKLESAGGPEWSADHVKAELGECAGAAGVKPGQMMFPLRVALSGRAHGPDIGAIIKVLGKARCIARLRDFCTRYGVAVS